MPGGLEGNLLLQPVPVALRPARRRRRGSVVVFWGFVWAVVLLAAVNVSPFASAVVVTPVVLIAVLSAWRTATRTAQGRIGGSADRFSPPRGSPGAGAGASDAAADDSLDGAADSAIGGDVQEGPGVEGASDGSFGADGDPVGAAGDPTVALDGFTQATGGLTEATGRPMAADESSNAAARGAAADAGEGSAHGMLTRLAQAVDPGRAGANGASSRPSEVQSAGLPTGLILAALAALGVTPLLATGGPTVMIVWLVVAGGVLAWQMSNRPTEIIAAGLTAAVLPALAGGCLVLATRQDAQVGVVLVCAYCLFDVANAAMGTGRTGGLVGAVSGILTVFVLAVIVGSLLAPPFTGSSPWLLCGAVALLAPVGVWLCGSLAPGRLPALRRLDSMVLAAPVWVIGVSVLLHR